MKKTILILFTAVLTGIAAKTDTLHIYSKAMQKNLNALIVIPDAASTENHLPAVYLLHGYSGGYLDWSKHMDLEALSERFQVFLICPEGSYNSWYIDSPLQKDSQYETHIIKEVIPYVDQHFPVISLKKGRAISGLSMGGHGALYLAIRHPALFYAAGSMSGVVDLRSSTKRYEIAQKIGDYEKYPQRWEENSVVNMIDQMRTARLGWLIDCGIEDPFIGINRALHQKMIDKKIAHTYIERPGGHSWAYWTNALKYHLVFFQEIREAALKKGSNE